MIRHAIAGERGNDITASGNGLTGSEQFKISSYNRTNKSFTVLVYASGAAGRGSLEVSIPSTIQDGKYYNNQYSTIDFRGEGLNEGMSYSVRSVTKDIDPTNGADRNLSTQEKKGLIVKDGKLTFRAGANRQFTKFEFFAQD